MLLFINKIIIEPAERRAHARMKLDFRAEHLIEEQINEE